MESQAKKDITSVIEKLEVGIDAYKSLLVKYSEPLSARQFKELLDIANEIKYSGMDIAGYTTEFNTKNPNQNE